MEEGEGTRSWDTFSLYMLIDEGGTAKATSGNNMCGEKKERANHNSRNAFAL